ncbi:hypothetical protein [Burkholderia pseudomallei]|uniref:hypothetical protein n=1 Tax=Burkholderia pseudomallei TaxID=28450 RepID=UPI0011AB2DEB|nr:hypothetical protein [Burkholderia pseudomallei]
MSNTGDVTQHHHRDWHGAHQPWAYRQEAFRWKGEQIAGINFIPLAKEMRAWLMQRGTLRVITKDDFPGESGPINPYTLSGASLTLIMARVVNAWHEFATNPTDHDEINAEIERLRLYNEIVLYAARICEVTVKQLLYCTQIPESLYKRMAIGALLESPCPDCKKNNGKTPHLISLVGSLAHPYHLCHEFDHCAMNHMDLVNKLRNSQAAHSEIQTLNARSTKESKDQLFNECNDVLNGFTHMLSHLEKLEDSMFIDLAEKGQAIISLKMNGLPAKDCNFCLTPGEKFVYVPPAALDPI